MTIKVEPLAGAPETKVYVTGDGRLVFEGWKITADHPLHYDELAPAVIEWILAKTIA